MKNPSASTEQKYAEEDIRARLADRLGVKLLRGRPMSLAGRHSVNVDAYCKEPKILVEIYSRVGELKSAQLGKIAKDILKLDTIRKSSKAWKEARMLIVLGSKSARKSIRNSWLAHAAETCGVEFELIELREEVKLSVLNAQKRQDLTKAR